jgi:hypothetical protein
MRAGGGGGLDQRLRHPAEEEPSDPDEEGARSPAGAHDVLHDARRDHQDDPEEDRCPVERSWPQFNPDRVVRRGEADGG